MASHLKLYKADYFEYIFALFCCAYAYKQTFSIPGSVFLVSIACFVVVVVDIIVSMVLQCMTLISW